MKRISLLVALITFTASATFATVNPKKSKAKVSKKLLGRECCTRSGTSQMGAQYSVEVCVGWFLSNSENAQARACAAAQTAINGATH